MNRNKDMARIRVRKAFKSSTNSRRLVRAGEILEVSAEEARILAMIGKATILDLPEMERGMDGIQRPDAMRFLTKR
jgi:hypothetical protein